jgi:hypothetical protein
MAIIFSLAIALLMVTALVGIGRRRFASAMPVAGSCSMAIAAACHGVPGKARSEESAWEERLMWGVMEATEEHEGVGHCGFSSLQMGRPQPGHIYM